MEVTDTHVLDSDSDSDMETLDHVRRKYTRKLGSYDYVPCDPDKTKMDMKQQLVLWKKTGYILDHMSMSEELLNQLVASGLFTHDMVDEIHSKGYDVERVLVMLSLVGQHGENVYQRFLKFLEDNKHPNIAHALRKTEKQTYFGEILPPAFTYFMDMSEFIHLHPHIGIKLSEDEKHILQNFIEGKIEMAVRKISETNKLLERKILKLLRDIEALKRRIRFLEKSNAELEEELRKALELIEILKARIKELEQSLHEWKSEVRRLKHFRHEQEALDGFIQDKGEEKRIGLSPMQMIQRMPTFVNSKKAQNTSSVKLKLLSAQVHMQLNKMYYVQDHMESLGYLEKRLNSFIGKPTDPYDKATAQDVQNIKGLLQDTTQEKQSIIQELTDEEKIILEKEQEIQKLRSEIFGKSANPNYKTEGHTSLKSKMFRLLDCIEQLHKKKIAEIQAKHRKEIEAIQAQIRRINMEHQKEKDVLKWRMRVKVGELHRREALHRRKKHLVNVLCRYHAKNMNATVPVETCRKIVKDIIADSYKLRKMVDESEQLERNPGGSGPQIELEEEEREGTDGEKQDGDTDDEGKDKQGDKGKKGKKGKKKEVDFLKNQRLAYIADRLFGEWRNLGVNLGLTLDKMDMIEIEAPFGVAPGLAMLRAWKDEGKAKMAVKATKLVKALLQMGRKDLAIIVLPLKKVDILLAQIDEENKKPVAEAPPKTTLGGLEAVREEEPGDVKTGAETNRLADVPVLPSINVKS